MKRVALAAAAMVAGMSAQAAEIAPGEVPFENGAVAQSLTGAPGDPEQGRIIVSSKSLGNCVSCHVNGDMSEVPFQGEIGPMLDGVGARWSEAEVRGIVANAKKMFPGTMMPAFYKTEGFIRPGDAYTGKAAPEDLPPILSAQQIEDVVAYLMTLDEF